MHLAWSLLSLTDESTSTFSLNYDSTNLVIWSKWAFLQSRILYISHSVDNSEFSLSLTCLIIFSITLVISYSLKAEDGLSPKTSVIFLLLSSSINLSLSFSAAIFESEPSFSRV